MDFTLLLFLFLASCFCPVLMQNGRLVLDKGGGEGWGTSSCQAVHFGPPEFEMLRLPPTSSFVNIKSVKGKNQVATIGNSLSLEPHVDTDGFLKLPGPTSNSEIESSVQLNCLKGIEREMELWRRDGLPSTQLLKLMSDVVSGLAHLHELGIIHRDLKPQNVLISSDGIIKAKLSDMGISKRLQADMSSLSRHSTGCGTSGWQAPEQLLHGRQTRAVDLFSLGCIIFYCITKGRHPFGDHFERDKNILDNYLDLFLVDHIPEVVHLLSQLLDPDLEMRPKAAEVLCHPFFWSSKKRLSFLKETSDRIDKVIQTDLRIALEKVAPSVFGGKWGKKLDAVLIAHMGQYRKYNFKFLRDLLRLIRNLSSHYRELPLELQVKIGSLPEGFDRYFSSRFPRLLIEVYKVMYTYCREEDSFSKYLKRKLGQI